MELSAALTLLPIAQVDVPIIEDRSSGLVLTVLGLLTVALACVVLAALYFWVTGRNAQHRFHDERLGADVGNVVPRLMVQRELQAERVPVGVAAQSFLHQRSAQSGREASKDAPRRQPTPQTTLSPRLPPIVERAERREPDPPMVQAPVAEADLDRPTKRRTNGPSPSRSRPDIPEW